VLDINVNGEMIYDLAATIAARDIPFVFVTGYGSEAIEERFKSVPVLQKPVDKAALMRVLSDRRSVWGHDEVPVAVGNQSA
jgi:hypothetical protein